MQDKNISGIAEVIMLAGSQDKLAITLGVEQQNISTWLKRGYVPFKRAAEIEAQYGVPRIRLINPKYLVDSLPAYFTADA